LNKDWGNIAPKKFRRKLVGITTGGVGGGQELAKIIAQGWKELDTYVDNLPNLFEFRPSMLPYCAVVALAEEPIVPLKWGKDFFFNSGTANHNLYQSWLPKLSWGKYLWGNWQCSECSTWTYHSYRKACPNCGNFNLAYREIEISFTHNGVTMVGHIDLVYWVPEQLPIIIDIKTARENRLDGNGLPFASNLHQIFAYCFLFEKNFNVTVSGIVLAYVPREIYSLEYDDFNASPTGYLWGAKYSDKIREMTETRLHKSFNGRNAELFIRQNGFNLSAAQALLKSRPCVTLRDYRDWEDSDMNCKCPHWVGDHCGANVAAIKELTSNLRG
jgi:hypothetical protein